MSEYREKLLKRKTELNALLQQIVGELNKIEGALEGYAQFERERAAADDLPKPNAVSLEEDGYTRFTLDVDQETKAA